MRGLLTICCVAAAGWALWPMPADLSVPAPVPVAPALDAGTIRGPVRVIDGDTFDLGGVRIRLQGVDAPERGQSCRDARGRDWTCGAWATAEVRALIGARPLECRDLGERTHGRVVAACRLDGADLGAMLVARGLVLACPRFARQHAHSQGYEALETAARRAGLGLHAGRTPERAGFCTVRGPAPAVRVQPAAAYPPGGDCAIKGNIARDGTRIYHRPGQRDYAATVIDPHRGERWFCSEAEAQAAGWRPARR